MIEFRTNRILVVADEVVSIGDHLGRHIAHILEREASVEENPLIVGSDMKPKKMAKIKLIKPLEYYIIVYR